MTASRLQEEVIEPSRKGLKREIPDQPGQKGKSAFAASADART